MKPIAALFAAVLGSTVLFAGNAPDRFVEKVRLSSDLTAVVAEGDFEAHSTGSLSVRLYSAKSALPGDNTTFFVAGVIQERDGHIEKVVLADVDGDGRPEIVVIVRCVGTGSFLSAQAFAVNDKSVRLRASVADLQRDADVLAALKTSVAKN